MAERQGGASQGFRLPLQTGTSALRHLLAGSLTFVPGYLLVLSIAATAFVWPEILGPGAYVGVAAIALIGFGTRSLRHAIRDRPTDLLVSAAGARVEGGPHAFYYGMTTSWNDLAQDKWHVRAAKDCSELVTGTGDSEMVLAHATDAGEAFSLQEIADLIHATAQERTQAQKDSGERRFCCPACGAPLNPDDADTVTCAYCQHPVPVPAELRQRVRAARQLQASARVTPQLIQRFMTQPNARRVNAIGSVAALAMLGAWPGAAAAGAWLYHVDRLTVDAVVGLIILAPASIVLLYAVASAAITNRCALQLVTMRLSARSGSSGRPECRVCGATLPTENAVVTCPFCGTANILGIDLRRSARDALGDEEELRFTLELNANRRKLALTGVAFALAGTVLGALLFAVGCL